jgi:hypothetical protein
MKNVFLKSSFIILLFLFGRCGQKTAPTNQSSLLTDTQVSTIIPKPAEDSVWAACNKCMEIQCIVLDDAHYLDTITLYRDKGNGQMYPKNPYYLKIKNTFYKIKAPDLSMCGHFTIKSITHKSIINKSNRVGFLLQYSCKDYFLSYYFHKKGKHFFLTTLYTISNKDEVMEDISKTQNDITDLVEITNLNIPISRMDSVVAKYIDVLPKKALYFKRKDSLAFQEWWNVLWR